MSERPDWMRLLGDTEQRARDLIVFADGVEEAGLRVYAQRARVVADDLLRIAADLRAERSARLSIQQERDRLRAQTLSRWSPAADSEEAVA
jgi:hypothetical protein